MFSLDTLAEHSKEIQLSLIKNEIESLKMNIETKAAGEVVDELLYFLLNAMSLLFILDKEFRKNISGFRATYVICSEDKTIDVSAVFKEVTVLFRKQDGMEVKDTIDENPTTMVKFKDGKTMVRFLLAENPDVLAGMLNNQLSVSGNLNYLFKFVYMIKLIPDMIGLTDFQQFLKDYS